VIFQARLFKISKESLRRFQSNNLCMVLHNAYFIRLFLPL